MRPAEEARTEVSLTHMEPVRYVGRTPDGRTVYEWRNRTYVEVELPSIAHNPNAVSTCGCGHSFKTADDAGAPDPCGDDGRGCC